MLRRNLLVLSVVLVFVVALSACGSSQDTDIVTDPEPQVEAEPETETMDDTQEGDGSGMEVEPEPIPQLEPVFFDYDKSTLGADAKRALQKNADQLKSASSVSVTIEGHCDERGTNAYNLALGEKRAKAAMQYLKSLGVSTSMRTVSYGEERPFASGSNESAWAKNRRAHFVVNS